MSEILALIVGVVIGFAFVALHDDVVLVNFNVDGTKWVKHDGKKYNLFNAEGGAE